MNFPAVRTRRLRRTATLRNLVSEVDLSASRFVYPLFVVEDLTGRRPIDAMPGIDHLSIDEAVKEVGIAQEFGVSAVMLFGLPAEKDPQGSSGWAEDGAVQKTITAIKNRYPSVVVISDVCLCEYTSHGHCGALNEDGSVDNDASTELLARIALSHAEMGVDCIAPSDMMDGRVGVIREVLDDRGFENLPIMVHSAKYASSFYGPFREAAQCAPQFGDRRGYQMDPRNSTEALREVELDLAEGADIVMIKPALPYLDVIKRVKQDFRVPVAAYQVSGEYSMIKSAGAAGLIDERAVALESLTAIRRAGADLIVTYYAKDVASWLY